MTIIKASNGTAQGGPLRLRSGETMDALPAILIILGCLGLSGYYLNS